MGSNEMWSYSVTAVAITLAAMLGGGCRTAHTASSLAVESTQVRDCVTRQVSALGRVPSQSGRRHVLVETDEGAQSTYRLVEREVGLEPLSRLWPRKSPQEWAEGGVSTPLNTVERGDSVLIAGTLGVGPDEVLVCDRSVAFVCAVCPVVDDESMAIYLVGADERVHWELRLSDLFKDGTRDGEVLTSAHGNFWLKRWWLDELHGQLVVLGPSEKLVFVGLQNGEVASSWRPPGDWRSRRSAPK